MCAMFDDAILSAACMLLVSDCLFNRLCNDVLYNVHHFTASTRTCSLIFLLGMAFSFGRCLCVILQQQMVSSMCADNCLLGVDVYV